MTQPPQLKAVPDPPTPPRYANGNGGVTRNGNYGERLARIESKMMYVATGKDISDLKVLIAEKDSDRSKWLIGMMITVLLGMISASVFVTVAMLRIPQ